MIVPRGSLLSFTSGINPPIIVAVDSVVATPVSRQFIRSEWTNELQRKVKEIDGSSAIFDYTAKNKPFEIFTGCGPETPRPTVPDDVSGNLTHIFQRFDTVHYEIKGIDSLPAQVDSLNSLAKAHQALLSEFEAYLAYVKSDISIVQLNAIKLWTFSYLTSTTLTLSGRSLGAYDPQSNCLITKFSMEPTIEYPANSANTTSVLYKSFTMEVENRVIVPLEQATWGGT